MDPKKATAVISENTHLVLDVDAKIDTSLYDLASIVKSTTDLSNEWIKDILPNITLVSSEIIDYDPTFQSTYQQLMEMAKAGKTTGLMQQLLAILVTTFEKNISSASSIEEATRKFVDGFNAQYEKIAAAISQVDQNNIELDQEITELEKELNSLEGMLHRDEIIRKIEELKKKANLLSEVREQLGVLLKATKDISPAAAIVAEGWVALNNNLNQSIDRSKQISTGQPGIIIEVELQALNEQWNIILKQVEDLNPANQ